MAEPGYEPPEKVVALQIQKINERLNRLERPTGSQNNRNKDKVQAALDDLQEQAEQQQQTIDYLSSLKTYSASDNDYITNITGANTDHPETTPSVNFTLSETMRVRITLRSNTSLSTSGAASAFITANALMRLFVDGALQSGAVASAQVFQQVPGTTGNQGASADGQLVSEVVVTLQAGSHSVRSGYFSRGDGASVSISIFNRSLAVQILGRP